MSDTVWSCSEVPDWEQDKCCPYCHASDERSFVFQVHGKIKRLCCKYSLPYIKLHREADIIILDTDLLLTTGS